MWSDIISNAFEAYRAALDLVEYCLKCAHRYYRAIAGHHARAIVKRLRPAIQQNKRFS